MEFGLFDDGIVFDHAKQKARYFHRGENRIDLFKSSLREKPEIEDLSFGKARSSIDRDKFCEKVEQAKDYIRSGDIFQAVLSKRYKIPFKGSLLKFYRALYAPRD